MNGNRRKPVEEPEHVWQLFHHLRHWSVENLHHRRAADEVDDVLQGVPLDPFLRPGLGENPGPHPRGTLNHPASAVEHNGHVNDLVQEKRTATVGSRLSSHRQQRICWTCTLNIDHLVNVLQLENLSGKPWESASPPRQRCRRHAANTAHLALHNNGHVTIFPVLHNTGKTPKRRPQQGHRTPYQETATRKSLCLLYETKENVICAMTG